LVVETAAKSAIAGDSMGERVCLNNVKVDGPPNLDSTGSTDHDADESEVSTEADLEEDDAPNGNSTLKRRKKISNYYHMCVVNLDILTLLSETKSLSMTRSAACMPL